MKSREFLSKIGAIGVIGKKTHHFSGRTLMAKIYGTGNFEDQIEQLLNEFWPVTLFEHKKNKDILLEFDKLGIRIEDDGKSDGINCITKLDMKRIPLLKRIKANYLFYKGDPRTLMINIEDSVSVVGSRDTPILYKGGVREWMPDKKTIVSGLAYGADVIAHAVAIERKQKIIVFPAVDIFQLKPRDVEKREILQYAENNGIILSSIFPGSRSFDKSIFLIRNKGMAQISKITMIVYFNGKSGTLSHAHESAKLMNRIFIPKNVLKNNYGYLEKDNYLKIILDRLEEI